VLELLFAAYHGAAVLYAVRAGLWGAIPFLLLYCVGFLAVSGASLLEPYTGRARREARREIALRAP
jgi:hypothetical protein